MEKIITLLTVEEMEEIGVLPAYVDIATAINNAKKTESEVI